MKLSISVVLYRQEKYLAHFLESLFRFPPSADFEVMVVDNSCYPDALLGDHHLESLREKYLTKPVRFIVSEVNLGFGKGHNVAALEARGEFLAFCNTDLEVTEGAFDRLVACLEDHHAYGLVGPRLMLPDGGVQDSYRRFPKFWNVIVKRLGLSRLFRERMDAYLMSEKDPYVTEPVDWVVGAMMMRKGEFESLGGFDERFFLFFEDTDLCRRVWKQGKQVVYCAESRFLHAEKRLSDSRSFFGNLFQRTFWLHVASAFKYFWKWRGAVGSRQ